MKPTSGIALGLLGLAVIMAGSAQAAPARTETSLNLRTGPGTSYRAIAAIPARAPVNVVRCYRSGWCKVTWAGRSGYVSQSYLTDGGYDVRYYPRRSYSYYDYYGPTVGFWWGDGGSRRYYRRDHDGYRGDWGRDRPGRPITGGGDRFERGGAGREIGSVSRDGGGMGRGIGGVSGGAGGGTGGGGGTIGGR